MTRSFFQGYLSAFHSIHGWFSFDAALLFMAYTQVLDIPPGDVLEIGVHHGLSSIAVAALRGPSRQFFAIDLFDELQDQNVSRSGQGNRAIFEGNMREFYPSLEGVRILGRASSSLRPEELGNDFTFCHIDGGHSRVETYNDLRLSSQVTRAGGLIAIDDYFNPLFPGVCEGAAEFMLRDSSVLRPLAIGFQKVLFQKQPARALNMRLRARFPFLEQKPVTMWGYDDTLLFCDPLRKYFDLNASSPTELVPLGQKGTRAILTPQLTEIRARPGCRTTVDVLVRNTSGEPFPVGGDVFGLSYHLLSLAGEELIHDNDRFWITEELAPGQSVMCGLPVLAPETGAYWLEIDLVWEGVMWFADVGNPTSRIKLDVSND
jgi:hypothetical protein